LNISIKINVTNQLACKGKKERRKEGKKEGKKEGMHEGKKE